MPISASQAARYGELYSKASTGLSADEAAELSQLEAAATASPAPAQSDRPQQELTNEPRSSMEQSKFSSLAMQARQIPIVRQMFGPGEASGLVDSGVAPAIARYGIPMAATAAATPFLPAAAPFAAAAALSGVGLTSSAIGGTLAQLMEMGSGERTGLDKGQIASEAVMGFTPVKTTGGILSRLAVNVPSFEATSEIGRYLQDTEAYGKPKDTKEALMRFGAPAAIATGSAFIGGKGTAVNEGVGLADAIRAERQGGAAMLSDVFPAYAASRAGASQERTRIPNSISRLEADQLHKGSALANELLANMDGNIAESVAKAFPFAEGSEALATDLRKHVGALTRLQDDALKAAESAKNASILAQKAEMEASVELPKLKAKAEEAGLEAISAKGLYDAGRNKIFGLKEPDLVGLAVGQRAEDMKLWAKAAKDTAKAAIGDLYSTAGVGPNDAVASLSGVLAKVDAAHVPGGVLAGDEAYKNVRSAIIKAFPEAPGQPTMFDARGNPVTLPRQDATITLEQYRELQSGIAHKLAAEGKDPKMANAIANEAYNAVRSASDEFIAATRGDTFPKWKAAQTAAAAEFAARETDAIGMLAEGRISDLYNRIAKEGPGAITKELDAYAGVIASTFDRANPQGQARALEAAGLFKQNVSKMIRDEVVDRSIDRSLGFNRDFRNVDFGKLVGEIETLSSKGFPIEQLGLGSKKDVAALARIASSNEKGGYTVAELDTILKDMKSVGLDAAVARRDYEAAVMKEMLSNGHQDIKVALAEQKAAASKAKLDADGMQAAYDAVKNNPLMQLLNGQNLKLAGDDPRNMKYADRLLTLGPDTAGKFMEALTATGRGQDAAILKDSALATVMNKFAPVGNGPQKLDLQRIANLFFSGNKDETIARETLQSVMGNAEYNNLVKNYAKPIKDMLSSREILGITPEKMQALFADPNALRMKGNVGGGFMVNIPVIKNMVELYQSGRYRTLYTLYVDPKWSHEFAAAGRDMNRFVAGNPVAATVLKLAMDEDQQRARVAP